jgi:hypothetical protein
MERRWRAMADGETQNGERCVPKEEAGVGGNGERLAERIKYRYDNHT